MRKPRYYYESNFCHVMVQGDEKKFIFKDNICKDKYLYYLRHNTFKNDIEIIAYCVMDNHVHALLFCNELKRISKCMQETNTSFAIFFNNRRKKIGHVFRERFRSESIYTKDYLLNCIKYIHQNPIKANICDKAGEYQYSSFNSYMSIQERMLEICDFNPDDIGNILKNTNTITKFMDDEYSKADIMESFHTVRKKYENNDDELEKTVQIYKTMKEKCKVTDCEIANLMGISRITLYRRLRKKGYK